MFKRMWSHPVQTRRGNDYTGLHFKVCFALTSVASTGDRFTSGESSPAPPDVSTPFTCSKQNMLKVIHSENDNYINEVNKQYELLVFYRHHLCTPGGTTAIPVTCPTLLHQVNWFPPTVRNMYSYPEITLRLTQHSLVIIKWT